MQNKDPFEPTWKLTFNTHSKDWTAFNLEDRKWLAAWIEPHPEIIQAFENLIEVISKIEGD